VAKISDVTCQIDKLSIHIVGEATKHNWLDSILAPLLSGMIKHRLAGTIEDYLRKKLEHINDQINRFFSSRPTEHLLIKMDQAMKQAYHQLESKQHTAWVI